MMTILALLGGGLVALYFGAEWLVRGSVSLALRAGVTPLLVGLTVVAYGTSTPELVVSTMAAVQGEGPVAIGNVVGSNILNIGLILGLTALLCPMQVRLQLLKFDVPVMLGVALLFLGLFADGGIVAWEGTLFLAALVVYTIVNVRIARREANSEVKEEFGSSMSAIQGTALKDVGFIVVGLAMLVLGSRLFVTGAVDIARALKVSEAVIGLTIVAAGTSLPELASSIMAAVRRQPDIAIGNVVGSNIYNVLGILGVAGVIASPVEGQGVGTADILVMCGVSFMLLVIAWTGFKLKRWEGVLLVALYGAYLWYLWPKT